MVELGKDTGLERDAAREAAAVAEFTVGKAIAQYLEWKADRVRPSTLQPSRRYLENYWSPLHKLSMDGVTKEQVEDRLEAIAEEHGKRAAFAARSHLAAMFSWAVRRKGVKQNAVAFVERPFGKSEARSRTLTDAELRAIWLATSDGSDFSKVVRLLLLCAARRSEIGALSWQEVDLAAAVLHIPGSRMKAGHPHDIRLSAPALAILSAQPRRGDRPWVFGRAGHGLAGWSFLKRALDKRIAESIGRALPPWGLHDLRRTTATRLVSDLGVAPHVVDNILAHTRPQLHRVYVTGTYATECRLALDAWASRLLEIVEGRQPGSNVVNLQRA